MHKKNRSAFFIISALYGASLFAIAFMFSLFSCSHEPIFWAIDREIKLREADIKGNVYSIILHRNHLYAANGQIYAKSLNSEGGWTLFPFPQPDGYISTLASGSDGTNAYLYALAMQRDEQQVWVLGTSGWQKIEGASSGSLLGSKAIALFDNGGNAAGINAYIRVNGKVYKLNGINPVSSLGANITNNGASDKTVACAHLGGNDWFSDTVSICSTNGIPAAKLYKASGKTISYSTDGTNYTSSVSTGETITCIAYDKANNRLIAGTKKGLEAIPLNSTGVPQSAGTLESNAEAALGTSEIFSVASFGDADGNALYAGAGKEKTTKTNALWGYYPWRGNWNYE